MAIALAVFAVVIAVASAAAVIFPSGIVSYAAEYLAQPGGIWWASSTRLLLAVLLWFSAPVSRTPITFKVLAVVALLAAVGFLILGSGRLLILLNWLASQPQWIVRVPSGLGVAFGAFLLWSVSRKWTGN